MAQWQGPFEVVRQVGPVDYNIKLKGRRKETQSYCVSLLKPWKAQEALLITPSPTELKLGHQVLQVHKPVPGGEGLTPTQRKQLLQLTEVFATVFSR